MAVVLAVGTAVGATGISALFAIEPDRSSSEVEVILANGDRITGGMQEISEGLVRLKHPSLPDRLDIPLENIARISFPQQDSQAPQGEAQVSFPNGNTLSGKIITMNRERVVLETEYASRVSIKKSTVASIITGGVPKIIFNDDFSTLRAPWFPANKEWKIRDGNLTVNTGGRPVLTRPLAQEGEITYEWEVAAKNCNFQGGFRFFTSGKKHYLSQYGYLIQMEGDNVYLQRVEEFHPTRVGEHRLKDKPNKVKFNVHYDPEKGTLNVWANSGKPVITYTDPSPWKVGLGMYFWTSQPATYDYLRITAGYSLPADLMEKGSEASDLVHFRNGERALGEVETITEDTLTLRTEDGAKEFKRKDTFAVVFNRKNITTPEPDPKAAKVTLRNLEKFSLRTKSLDGKFLTAESSYTDEIKIARSHLKEILYREKTVEAPRLDKVTIVGSHTLSGTVKNMAEGFVRLKHPCVQGDIKIPLERVSRLTFPGGAAPKAQAGDVVLVLTNGEMVAGALTSIEGEEIILKAGYGPTFKIGKVLVKAIILSPGKRAFSLEIFPAPVDTSSIVYFNNGDKASGAVKTIGKDVLVLETEYGKFELKRDQTRVIVFNQKNARRPAEDPKAAEVIFHNSGRLSLRIQTLDKEVLTGHSSFAGEMTITRSAIKQIVFIRKK